MIWSPAFNDLTPALVQEAQALGFRVVPWTVNQRADMARLMDWGVDGLITDDPALLRDLMRERGMPLPRACEAAERSCGSDAQTWRVARVRARARPRAARSARACSVSMMWHCASRAVAAVAQRDQVLLERAQLAQALAHVAQVRIERHAGRGAVGLAAQVQPQQRAHLVERHVHGAAQADEAQPVHVGIGVEPVAVVAAGLRRDQALFLVVADVGGAHAASGGGIADAVTLLRGRVCDRHGLTFQ